MRPKIHVFDEITHKLMIFRFSTSRTTLTQFQDTFFTALLSNRIQSLLDEKGYIFIDRWYEQHISDIFEIFNEIFSSPELFGVILNYLRTKDIDLKRCDRKALIHEAEYYNISPLVKRLHLIEQMDNSHCGDLLFYGLLSAPSNITILNFNTKYNILMLFSYFSCTNTRSNSTNVK